ncbi:MAG: hypothetical protein MJ204_00290 [Bacteroidales bacterium]|nr:hypothetical protein [Bacteroidales bacterium]
MVRVLVITICVVLDVWLLHQIWVEEKHLRTKSEKLLWTIGILLTHAIASAVYIFLDTTKDNNNENTENNL